MRHNPALPTAKQRREGELQTSFGETSYTPILTTALGMHNPEVITRTNTQIIQNSCVELINYAVIEQTE